MAAEEKGVVAPRHVGLVAGPAVFALLAFVPSGLHRIPGFGHRPAYAAAAAGLMAVWWFTEAVPIAVTAAAPLVLYPLFGVFGRGLAGDALRTVEPYLDAYIFLFLGGMTLGAAMEQWGLHRRVALYIMRAVGTEPRRLLLGMLVATAFVSMWISNTATAVMMMPIGMALVAQLEAGEGGRRLGDFGASLMLSIAYAANVGGIGTKIGTGTNSIFVGFLSEKLGYEMSFLRYMAVGFPFVALFIPIVWWVLWQNAKGDLPGATRGREVLERELALLGAWSKRERFVALIFLGAAGLWILGDVLRPLIAPLVAVVAPAFKLLGKHYEAGVAMTAAAVLVATRTVSRAQLARVPWSTLLLLGGSFAMAAGIEGSGLSGFLTQTLDPVARLPLLAQLGLVSAATVALSAVASNTATVNVLLNVLPRSLPVLSACALAASCDFALPAGTPPNAIVFGSGYVRLPQMMRIGLVLDLLAAALITAYAFFYLRFVL
ncbi:MAG: DASS family sodium-coupled anion symporter [Polyangiaceae bacterium]|nr:DASS family sodium-coupled anion symporter [Polyangiaceae bacterium]